jgi:hypothetical protein
MSFDLENQTRTKQPPRNKVHDQLEHCRDGKSHTDSWKAIDYQMFQEVTKFNDNQTCFECRQKNKHKQFDSAGSVNKKRAKSTTEEARLSNNTEGNNDAEVNANRLIQAILSMHDVPITPVYDTREEVRRKASQSHQLPPFLFHSYILFIVCYCVVDY